MSFRVRTKWQPTRDAFIRLRYAMPSRVGNGPIAPSKPPSQRGPSDQEGPVTPLVRGRARRPYANCDRMPRWRSSSLSHQCPKCCTGPVPPSLSQPTGGGSIASAFETAASSGVRACARLPEACPSSIPPGLPAEGRPAVPAIPRGRRPGRPSSGCSQGCIWKGRIACGICPLPLRQRRSKRGASSRYGLRREWCREGWLQLPLLHQGVGPPGRSPQRTGDLPGSFVRKHRTAAAASACRPICGLRRPT